MSEITRMSAGKIVAAIRSRRLTCAAVMRDFADRIERLNSRINALVQIDLAGAMAMAESLDRRLDAGEDTGLLTGVPYAVKDCFNADGFLTTHGAAALRGNRPTKETLHVTRLRAAGAIPVAKTNIPEFCFAADTENALYGRTRNPYALNRSPGSSSGGSAAALGYDLVALADGSDAAGSIRLPAAWCNVCGLKPTAGTVPVIPPNGRSFDTLHVAGPMARTVDDLRLAMHVMSGPDPRSPLAPPVVADTFAEPLGGDLTRVRIALSLSNRSFRFAPAVTDALSSVPGALELAGATVVDADPGVAFAARQMPVFRARAAADYAGWAADEHGLELGHHILDLIGQSRRLTGYEIERAEEIRGRAWDKMAAFFQEYDLICWPASSAPPFMSDAPDAGATDWGVVEIANLLNLPGAAVPAGMTPEGLPVGIQFMGPPGADRLVLEAARAVEAILKIRESTPAPETLQSV